VARLISGREHWFDKPLAECCVLAAASADDLDAMIGAPTKVSFNGKAFSSRSMVLRSGRSRALLTCTLPPHRQDLRLPLVSSQEAQEPDAKSWITGDLNRCRHAHRRSNAVADCSDPENRSWNRWARPLFRTSTRQARALNRDKFSSRRSDWAAIIRGLRKDIHPFSQFRGCEEI
jgi:hypothetical protein